MSFLKSKNKNWIEVTSRELKSSTYNVFVWKVGATWLRVQALMMLVHRR